MNNFDTSLSNLMIERLEEAMIDKKIDPAMVAFVKELYDQYNAAQRNADLHRAEAIELQKELLEVRANYAEVSKALSKQRQLYYEFWQKIFNTKEGK